MIQGSPPAGLSHAPDMQGPSVIPWRSASVLALTAGATCRRRQCRRSSARPGASGGGTSSRGETCSPSRRASLRRWPAGAGAPGSIPLYARPDGQGSSESTYAAAERENAIRTCRERRCQRAPCMRPCRAGDEPASGGWPGSFLLLLLLAAFLLLVALLPGGFFALLLLLGVVRGSGHESSSSTVGCR